MAALLAPVLASCAPVVLAGGRGAEPPPVAEAPPGSGRLLVPGPMEAARGLPVVVFLPYTTGTAEDLLGQYERELARAIGSSRRSPPGFDALVQRLGAQDGGPGSFALLLVAGRGSAADYATGEAWAHTIQRYERQVFGDLALYAAAGLDTTRVVLVGHSLGGDLAWAIALRNPARVHGAVVMGSRASYRASPADHRALAARGVRIAFLMGEREEAARLAGARRAAGVLDALGVAYRWEDIPGAGHTWAPLPSLAGALGFVLGPR